MATPGTPIKERWILANTAEIQLAEKLVGVCSPSPINQISAESMCEFASIIEPLICIQSGGRYEVVANAKTFHFAISAGIKRLRICVVDTSKADALISYDLVVRHVIHFRHVSRIGTHYRHATKQRLKGQLSRFGEIFKSQMKLAMALGFAKNTVFKTKKRNGASQLPSGMHTSDQTIGDQIRLGGSIDAENS